MAGAMRQASGPTPGPRFSLKRDLELYVMADGSGVLADPELGEAHALNADAVALLGAEGPREPGLRDRSATLDLAAAEASRFEEQLRTLGLIEAHDD